MNPSYQTLVALAQDFDRDIKRLAERHPEATSMIQLHSQHLTGYLFMLPDDEEAFGWLARLHHVTISQKPHTISVHLKTCQRQLEKGRLLSSDPVGDIALVQSLIQQITHLKTLLDVFLKEQRDFYRTQPFNNTPVLLTRDRLNSLKESIRFSLYQPGWNRSSPENRVLTVDLFAPEEIAPVLYQPYHTIDMLKTTLLILSRRETPQTVNLLFGVEPTYGVLSLAIPDLRMSIMQWEAIRRGRERHLAAYEHLREIGSDIEPLTWDEGYGQGISVHLPWAKAL